MKTKSAVAVGSKPINRLMKANKKPPQVDACRGFIEVTTVEEVADLFYQTRGKYAVT